MARKREKKEEEEEEEIGYDTVLDNQNVREYGKEEEQKRSKKNEQEIGDGKEKTNGHARGIEEIREDGRKTSLLLISSQSFIVSLPSLLLRALKPSRSSSPLISLLSLFLFLIQRNKKYHVKNKDIWKFLDGIYFKKEKLELGGDQYKCLS
ncbi:uncharacterized protein LOC127150563 [Cucumis melo]|uniref:Uncharacterized protein LOC127150563 n=1 Tax=Cucumis melo TaxID=3656 RepID=A0ABM3L2X8_CUCME|nr:uncharacterized protein LOC127150563 [Cucumis melo]